MTDQKQRTVHIAYRRQVSDGRYGTEAAEVSLEWFIDDDIDSEQDDEVAEEMLRRARDIVLGQLKGSTSEQVRQAVLPRPTAEMASAAAAATGAADGESPF